MGPFTGRPEEPMPLPAKLGDVSTPIRGALVIPHLYFLFPLILK